MSRLKFRTQFSEVIHLVVDDGDPVEGFISGASESPETLLARLRQGGEVSIHDGSRFFTEDFIEETDRVQDLFVDDPEEERPGGSDDLGKSQVNPSVEKNSSVMSSSSSSAPPASSPANAES